MPIRSEIDDYFYDSMEKAIARFGLNYEEVQQCNNMDKRDTELADYKGYPSIQARILTTRKKQAQAMKDWQAACNPAGIEIKEGEFTTETWGMGLLEHEVHPQKIPGTVKLELISGGLGQAALSKTQDLVAGAPFQGEQIA